MSFRKESKLEIKEFPIQALGGKKVHFKKMNAKQLAEFFDIQRTQVVDGDNQNVVELYARARMIASSLVDSKGVHEYTTSQADLDELVTIDGDVFTELYVIAGRLIGYLAPLETTDGEVAKEAKN